MLALDSPRWATLKASAGGSGALAARLLQAIRAGAVSEFGELYHQCCHQLGVGEVAYAAVPHVIDIARGLPVRERVEPLVIAGTVAACCAAFPSETPPIPDDLRADYEASARPAHLMATAALGETVWRRGEVVELLGVVAAFQAHCDLAIHLFLHGGSDYDLSCPECGEYIRWREGAGD
jgi:hypothetical protein